MTHNKNKQIKKVGVLCYYQFPQGMAPTNRIIAYSKGLVNNDIKVEVVIFRPLLDTNFSNAQGNIEGVSYTYTHIRKSNISLFRKKLIERPLAILKTIKHIKKSHSILPFDCILLSFDNLLFLYIFVPLLRLLNIKLSFIGDEYPIPIREKLKNKIPFWRLILYKIIYIGIKSRILMTDNLKSFYNKKISYKPTHIMSSIIDVERFKVSKEIYLKSNRENYFCYMGNAQLSKDNLDNIIISFSIFSKKCSGYELRIYGTPSKEDEIILNSLIEKYSINNNIKIMGRVNYELVPEILAKAVILVTSQPNTKRAEGGFPTKLGEYLTSGTPTLLTNVGEISCYITDGKNAFLVDPSNPHLYANKLFYIINNYDEALNVANNGRNFVLNNFDSILVSKKLKHFLNSNI